MTVADNTTSEQLPDEKSIRPVVLLDQDGQALAHETDGIDSEELYRGNVLSFKDEQGKHHYIIQQVEDEDDGEGAIRVHVSPGKSNLLKSTLLLCILAGTWFLISYIIKLFS